MEEDECNIGLGLAIGGGRHFTASNQLSRNGERKPPVQFHNLFPPRRKEEEEGEEEEEEEEEEEPRREKQHKSKINVDEEEEEDTMSGKDTRDGGNNQVGMRKKLRLTEDQLTLLENSFREHNTLNQKQQLADQLNLRPRQVEVWFQNRRARTKLKQTEVDCEFLKKYCENLRNENRRLKREVEELRKMEPPPGCPFHIRVPKAATLMTMCPSCNRIMASGGEEGNNGALDTMKARPTGSCK